MLWLAGRFNRRPRRSSTATAAMMFLVALPLFAFVVPGQAIAQDQRPEDETAVQAISVTRLAYVITGDQSVDAVSKAGMTGLTRFLVEKTALEPGDPVGVNVASDELAFFPIIYWPVDANAAMPSADALSRIDAYMKNGGTVLSIRATSFHRRWMRRRALPTNVSVTFWPTSTYRRSSRCRTIMCSARRSSCSSLSRAVSRAARCGSKLRSTLQIPKPPRTHWRWRVAHYDHRQ